MKKVCILGGGTWGNALGMILHERCQVQIWDYYPEIVAALSQSYHHPKLKVDIPRSISFTNNIAECIQDSSYIIIVTISAAIRETCRKINAHISDQPIIVCAKGIESNSLKLLTDIVKEELGKQTPIAVLSGPSHAENVAENKPTAVVAASEDIELAEEIKELFITDSFRVFTQNDIIGVELGGALKNVIAISCGISDGLALGDNSKAALITRGLAEIVRLGSKMGAQPNTLYGLAGLGDLTVTCLSQHSRNWKFGNLLGQGLSPQEALDKVGMVVEGYHNAKAACDLGIKYRVRMPICKGVYDIIFKGKNVAEAVRSLLSINPRSEF